VCCPSLLLLASFPSPTIQGMHMPRHCCYTSRGRSLYPRFSLSRVVLGMDGQPCIQSPMRCTRQSYSSIPQRRPKWSNHDNLANNADIPPVDLSQTPYLLETNLAWELRKVSFHRRKRREWWGWLSSRTQEELASDWNGVRTGGRRESH
jgi:hypothetical protein